MTASRALTLAASLVLFACDKPAPTSSPSTASAAAAQGVGVEAPTAAKAGDAPAGVEAAPAGDAAPAAVAEETGMEVDPNATEKVIAGPLSAYEQEGIDLPGERLHTIGWRDRHGLNALVITRQMQRDNGALLTATHLLRESDSSWTPAATFKELVDSCEFDLITLVKLPQVAVTDLNEDGLGEATFAWSAGCRSDISPVTHKVLLITKDEKYVLRGESRLAVFGGEYKADAAFQRAPAQFLAHAQAAWAETVAESTE